MTIPSLILALELSGQYDEELARRLQRRDPDAMKDLYDRFGRLAYSVVLAIVRDSPTAEDLVQETFLRVWNRMQAFEPGRGRTGAVAAGYGTQPRDRPYTLSGFQHGTQFVRTGRSRRSVAVRRYGARGGEHG